MKKPDSTCKNCKKRHFKCHSECEEYNDFLEKLLEYKKTINEQNRENNIGDAYFAESVRKTRRK